MHSEGGGEVPSSSPEVPPRREVVTPGVVSRGKGPLVGPGDLIRRTGVVTEDPWGTGEVRGRTEVPPSVHLSQSHVTSHRTYSPFESVCGKSN